MKEALLVLALVAAIAWLVVYIRRGNEEIRAIKSPSTKNIDETSQYHAVSLKYSSSACDAAKAMTGRRFLSGAAPRLPLPECDALECRCGFVHHSDRRAGDERRSPFEPTIYAGGTGKLNVERRERRDRRRSGEVIN